MAIRQGKYIDITSGVGGKSAVANREFIARIFTANPLCEYNRVYEFDSADAVMSFFGSSSEEYAHAAKYFGFVSKTISKAKKISFFRWLNKPNPATLYGEVNASTDMGAYRALDDGSGIVVKLAITYVAPDGDTETDDIIAQMVNDDFTSLSAVANYLKNYIDTTTEYNAECSFVDGKMRLSVAPRNAEDSRTIIGISFIETPIIRLLGVAPSQSPRMVEYIDTKSPAETASMSDALSDNYGSFYFIDTLTRQQAREIALWNQTKNYKYLYIAASAGYTNDSGGLTGDIELWADKETGLGGIAGTCLLSYKNKNDCIEALASALFATTDYSRTNSTKTFMYQQDDSIPASITNDSCANTLDALFVNYMGITQSAGGLIKFLQNGFNMDGVDSAVYCNEVWMKAGFWTSIMNLFLAVEKVPANDEGAGMIKTVMMDTVTTALRNGTIQPRKNLTVTQKAYIGQILGDTEAWKNVFNNGYVLDITIENVNDQYICKYLLVYSKGDAIRKVEGSDILI